MSDRGEPARLPRDEALRFGFAGDGDAWMAHLLAASRTELGGAIGSYELIEEVGRGGQGVVYRARQRGMQRDIAVKRLLAGAFASRAMRRRFEREVDVVSTLQHPGIVTVYGMDVVDDVPVLAMEWIDGQPLDAWARAVDARRDAQRLLRLFLRICDAVQHAHQRGVIHCDLKPSNILVDQNERPRVLDFGLARFLAGERDESGATRDAGFVGTRAYASPEQFAHGHADLDVRSDVYSLGIVLYELLVGKRPDRAGADVGRAAGAALHCDELSFARGSVDRELRIVLRAATAPRREERYASLADFAADLRRYASGRPILAHPPAVWYVLRKFVARNRVAAALGAALLLTLIAFAVVSTLQARQLERERDAEATARGAAEDAATKAEAIQRFLVEDLLLAVEPKELGDDVSVGELLAVAAARAGERFAAQPELEVRVRRTLADVYDRLGRFHEAIAEQRLLLQRQQQRFAPGTIQIAYAELVLAMYLVKVEQVDEAIDVFHHALPILAAQQPPDHARISRAHRDLAACHEMRNDLARARAEYEAGLALLEQHAPAAFGERAEHMLGLARLHYRAGDLEEARRRYEVLLQERRRHDGPDAPSVAHVLAHLSDIDRAQGDLAAARGKREEALRILEHAVGSTHPWVAGALGDLAVVMVRDEDLAAAEQMLRRAIDITHRSRGEHATAGDVHRMLLAINLRRQQRHAEAAVLLEPTLRRFEAMLGPSAPASLRTRKLLVDAWLELGRSDDALDLARRHIEALRDSRSAADAREQREACHRVFRAAALAGEWEEALAASDQDLEILLADAAVATEPKITALDAALPVYRQHGTAAQVRRWQEQRAALMQARPGSSAETSDG